jgi:hypothetical protein
MKRTMMVLGATALFALPAVMFGQGTGGTLTFGGDVPTTYSITNPTNGNLSGAFADFGMTIAKGTLATPTPMTFRLRSNAAYKVTAQTSGLSGITEGTKTVASNAAEGLKTGDIGFGFTAAIDKSGASVVNGGAEPSRTDTIVAGYDVTGGWASVVNGHTPAFTKTLHDIASDTQILSGDRISASGDNGSNDNYLVVTVGVATLPQYMTPGAFSGTVTFTIAGQ